MIRPLGFFGRILFLIAFWILVVKHLVWDTRGEKRSGLF
jgi:hypothetical protein